MSKDKYTFPIYILMHATNEKLLNFQFDGAFFKS